MGETGEAGTDASELPFVQHRHRRAERDVRSATSSTRCRLFSHGVEREPLPNDTAWHLVERRRPTRHLSTRLRDFGVEREAAADPQTCTGPVPNHGTIRRACQWSSGQPGRAPARDTTSTRDPRSSCDGVVTRIAPSHSPRPAGPKHPLLLRTCLQQPLHHPIRTLPDASAVSEVWSTRNRSLRRAVLRLRGRAVGRDRARPHAHCSSYNGLGIASHEPAKHAIAAATNASDALIATTILPSSTALTRCARVSAFCPRFVRRRGRSHALLPPTLARPTPVLRRRPNHLSSTVASCPTPQRRHHAHAGRGRYRPLGADAYHSPPYRLRPARPTECLTSAELRTAKKLSGVRIELTTFGLHARNALMYGYETLNCSSASPPFPRTGRTHDALTS